MPGFKVTISNQDVAAWMEITNTFMWKPGDAPWPDNKKTWNGVLIQPGKYERMQASGLQSVGWMDIFWGVSFLDANEKELELDEFPGPNTDPTLTKTVFLGDRVWINIVMGGSNTNRPIPVSGSNYDFYFDRLFPLKTNGVGPAALRNFFAPFQGGITFWHDQDKKTGYDMHARQDAHDDELNSYTFELLSNATEIWLYFRDTGQVIDLLAKYNNLHGIVLKNACQPSCSHGIHMNPPQDPG